MTKKLSQPELDELTARFGGTVSPGEYYFPQPTPSEYFRVNIARVRKGETLEAVRRLGQALRHLAKNPILKAL